MSFPASAPARITAHSDDLALSDVLQAASLSQRTLVLSVRSPTGEGEIFVQRGDVVHAARGAVSGVEALYEMLTEKEVSFSVHGGAVCDAVDRTIFAGTQHLLLEAARLEDERARSRPEQPVPSQSERPPPLSSRPAAPPPSRSRAFVALVGLVAVLASFFGFWGLGALRARPEAAGNDARVGVAPNGFVDPVLVESHAPVVARDDSAVTPTVVVRLRVGEDGTVREQRIFEPRAGMDRFERAALDAVKTYRFRPARRDGKPIAAWTNVPVTFRGIESTAHVRIKGSDTIGASLAPELARAFEQVHPEIDVDVESIGSGAAFVGLLDGSAEIGASSRSINAEELDRVHGTGLRLEEFVIGYDGIAVIVHPSNPLSALSLVEIASLHSGHAHRFPSPDAPSLAIHRYGRPEYSGTQALFKERVGAGASELEEFASDTRVIERSPELVRKVASDPAGIGYVGIGFADDTVKVLGVSAGDGVPVFPNEKSISSGAYPIARPLLFYTRERPNAAVRRFIAFVRSDAGRAIVERSGFVAAEAPSSDPRVTAAPDDNEARELPTMIRIPFRRSSTFIDPENEQTIRALAVVMKRRSLRALIVGNSDTAGNPKSSRDLALVRAHGVVSILRDAGVDETAIEVRSAGATQPVASNSDPEGRDKNRRVDIFLLEAAPPAP